MMRKITLRGLRAHPVRFIATMLAVIFGTAFLSGALVLRESVGTTFENNTTAALKGVDAAIEPDLERAQRDFIANPTVDASLADTAREVPGVRAVAPTLEGSLSILDASGKATKPRATGFLRIDDDALNPYRLVSGRWPEAAGEVAVDSTTATENPATSVGNSIEVGTTTGRRRANVVGTVSYLTLGREGSGPNIVVHEGDAFTWLGAGEQQYQTILVAGDPGAANLVANLRAAVGPTVSVKSGDTFREEAAGAAAGLANALGVGLAIFAYVALFICIFIVYNTFTTVVAQRTRELALLRALGASAKQVRRAVLLEALVVGVVASLSGLLAGILLAFTLAKAAPGLVSAGNGSEVSLAISPATVVQVMLVGTIITMISAVLPAFRSARVRPLQAMRTVAVDKSGTSKIRSRIGLGLTLLGVASMVLSLTTRTAIFLAFGPPLLFLGLLFAGPNLASMFARAARKLGMGRRITSRLATDNLARNPRRAATTANALVIGVFLVVFVTAAGGALRDYAIDFISKFGGADLNIASENADAIPTELGPKIEAIPGVRDSVEVYGNFGRAAPPGASQQGGGAVFPPAATDLSKAESALGLKRKSGKAFAEIATGEAALQDFGELFGGGGGGGAAFPGLGDKIIVTFGNGTIKEYTIVTMMDVSLSVPPLLMSTADAQAVDPLVPVVQYSLTVEPGQVGAVKDQLDALTNDYSNLVVFEGAFVVQFLKDFFNGLISAVNALLGVAIVVAIFGIVNTLVLAITERTQEIGLLRAVGMTRSQLRSSVRSEAVLVSLLGTVLGVVSGLFVAYCVATTLIDRTGGGFSWPIRELLTITIAGVVVGVLSSLIPAHRAAKLDILDSIKQD